MLLLFVLCIKTINSKDEIHQNESLEKMYKEFFDNFNQKEDDLMPDGNYLNDLKIMILGKTGAGKSTLINHIFCENFTETGQGKPITQDIKLITKEGVPLSIYDTPGLELDPKKQKRLEKDIYKIIKKQYASKNSKNVINLMIYCINILSNRYEQTELDFIKKISNNAATGNIPFFVVITQCKSVKEGEEFAQMLHKENLGVTEIIPVLAKDIVFTIEGQEKPVIIPAFGLDKLVDLMKKHLPYILSSTIENIQNIGLKNLRIKSHLAVAAASLLSTGIGGDFLPYSRIYLLIPTIWGMFKTINYIYDVDVPSEYMSDFVMMTIGAPSLLFSAIPASQPVDIFLKKQENDLLNYLRAKINEQIMDMVLGNNELYCKSKMAISNFQSNVNTNLNRFIKDGSEVLSELVKWFINLKGNAKLALPIGVVTAGAGELYMKYAEEYYIFHQKQIFENKKRIQKLFRQGLNNKNQNKEL